MRASGYARTEGDFYTEPPWVVDALLDAEAFAGVSWDPACGSGTIPRRMHARGLPCWGSDIADRGFGKPGQDFFATSFRVANIVSNPPYGEIQPFIDKALASTTGKVAILARLALLEGTKRREWFAQTPLARVWVSSRRVSMPPGGTDIPAKGGSVAFAWFVWDHRHQGAPVIGWI